MPTARVLVSTLQADGMLRLALREEPVAPLAADEVLVRVEAAPINPSDLGQMFGLADPDAAVVDAATLRVPVGADALAAMRLRVGVPVRAGIEGAGTVVDAGSDAAAQRLVGGCVALSGGGLYATLRVAKAADCLPLAAGTSARDGASAFVNPLTALGFVATARASGHSAIVHSAAASNLGRMLVRLCRADGIALVNVVRTPAQAALLRDDDGATHVVDASAPSFAADLEDALADTGATLGFDAVGGGTLAGDMLAGMEAALNRNASAFDRYGSATPKHVYVYGGLDTGAIVLRQSFGKAWSVGGWLLTHFLQGLDAGRVQALKERVAAEIETTFASRYAGTLSLEQVLDPAQVRRYARRATGGKYLVCP